MTYTNSPLVTYTNLSSKGYFPRTHVIDTITIHCFVGQVTAKRGCDFFKSTNRMCSVNYVVGYDGSIGLCIPESAGAWTSDSKSNDMRAVTIEVACDSNRPYAITDKAMESLIKLCADICKRNGIKALIWSDNKSDRINHSNGCNMTCHRDFIKKECPGDYIYNREGYIAEEVNKILKSYDSYIFTAPIIKQGSPNEYGMLLWQTLLRGRDYKGVGLTRVWDNETFIATLDYKKRIGADASNSDITNDVWKSMLIFGDNPFEFKTLKQGDNSEPYALLVWQTLLRGRDYGGVGLTQTWDDATYIATLDYKKKVGLANGDNADVTPAVWQTMINL